MTVNMLKNRLIGFQNSLIKDLSILLDESPENYRIYQTLNI